MRLSRRLRATAALLALLGVLSAQLAVAAHACPMLQQAFAAAEMSGPEHDCCEKDLAQPSDDALCQAHCLQGDQSRDKPSVPPVDSVASFPALPLPAMPAESRAPAPERLPLLLARDTSPSLAVRHCCLRF